VFLFGDEFGPHRPALQDQLTGDLKRISSIPHHGDRLLIPAEIRPDIRAALAARRTGRGSMSDSRTSSGQRSLVIVTMWLHL
jgi:hypothetical protein